MKSELVLHQEREAKEIDSAISFCLDKATNLGIILITEILKHFETLKCNKRKMKC